MKAKYTIITICAALAIILAGYFGISAVFNAYFNAGIDVYEETDNTDTVESAARETIFRCSYPLIPGWKATEQEDNSDFKDYVSTISGVASLVEFDAFSSREFEEIITDNDYSVIDTTVNDGKYEMTAAFRYKIIYGFYFRPTAQPSNEQIKTAVEDLETIVQEDDQLLQEFFKSIEGFKDDSDIDFAISYAASNIMHSMMYACEDPAIMAEDNTVYKEEFSLNECYQYGDKYILTDGKNTVLLSSVGGNGIALFYDAINKKFCGINLLVF